MNTLRKLINWPGAVLGFLAVLGFFSPIAVRAAHDHDHIDVTMVDYLGYDRSSEHYMIKVKRVVEGEARYSILHFLSNVSSLRGHEGERMQVSLSDDGRTWTKLSFGRHGTWRIHERE